MTKISFTLLFTLCISALCSGQSVAGTWKTIDDKDGKVKSHITITNVDGKLYGHIDKLFDPESDTCTKCNGDKKDKPLLGLEIIWDMKQDEDGKWSDGSIMDPRNGKTYKCKMELVEDNTLNVRGFLGFSLLGRTQTWYRVE